MQNSGIPRQVQARQPGLETEMTPAPDYGPRIAGSGRLKGKTALITGGDSGVGRATAVLFAREGANIAFHYRDEHQDAADTIEAIRQEGAEVAEALQQLKIPFVFTSACSSPHLAGHEVLAKSPRVEKPIDEKRLLALLARLAGA